MSPPGPEPSPTAPARRSVLLGLALVSGLFLLELALRALLTEPPPPPPGAFHPPPPGPGPHLLGAPLHLGWQGLEMVLAFAACWLCDLTQLRRGRPFAQRLALVLLVGSLTGATLGALSSTAQREQHDPVHAHGPPPPSLSLPRAAFDGGARGLAVCALWILGSMYPLALEAERLRSAAELSGVRSYLEPHFLLNSLNAVAGLVDEDPALARRLLSLLGDLLRDTLRARDAPQTLGQECAWLQRYAEVLELRHGDALRVRWELDPEAASLRVPRMLLQPLLENAILHGALRRPSGEVAVRTRVEGQGSRRRVRCTVEDNGPGLSAAAPARPGSFGLDSVRRRLALECPGASFTLDSSAAGTCATVSLPFSGSS